MEKYNFNTLLFAVRYVPYFMRGPRLVAWLKVLLGPLRGLHGRLYLYAGERREAAAINSQTLVLEHWLNKQFNPYPGPPIYISNTYFNLFLSQVYAHFISEGVEPPPYLKFLSEGYTNNYINFQQEYFNRGATFVVHVPERLRGLIEEPRLRAVVDRYVLADKSYAIQYY